MKYIQYHPKSNIKNVTKYYVAGLYVIMSHFPATIKICIRWIIEVHCLVSNRIIM